MKKIIVLIIVILTYSCDDFNEVVNFTEVENPNLSKTSIVGQPNSSEIWLSGIERQMANVLNEILILAELGSDNYVNTQTFFNQFLDQLDIRVTDPDIRDTQNQIARLAKMALFGLEEVGPGDPNYSNELQAEFHFYLGISRMYAGMYFSYLPQETLGAPVSATTNLESAVTSFDSAIGLNAKAEYHLARARCQYYLGNKSEAITSATNAINKDDDFTKVVNFDEKEDPDNTFEDALYERGTFDDLQPLPSLDFLDPKYSRLTSEIDPPVHFLKAEEAYLILAEANLADNKPMDAQQNLTDLLSLIGKREVRTIDDKVEQRTQKSVGSRPDKATVTVNGRAGLVLDRQAGKVDIPSVSGTSLTTAEISTLAADDPGLILLHRTRQEVFIAEGIRFVDMGIKLVIDENEILQNDNVAMGDPGTSPVIPSFIDSVKKELDKISFVKGAGTATTTLNVSKILVDNKNSNQVLPFH